MRPRDKPWTRCCRAPEIFFSYGGWTDRFGSLGIRPAPRRWRRSPSWCAIRTTTSPVRVQGAGPADAPTAGEVRPRPMTLRGARETVQPGSVHGALECSGRVRLLAFASRVLSTQLRVSVSSPSEVTPVVVQAVVPRLPPGPSARSSRRAGLLRPGRAWPRLPMHLSSCPVCPRARHLAREQLDALARGPPAALQLGGIADR